MSSLINTKIRLFSQFNSNDIYLALSILLICIAPSIGNFCVIGAFLINIYRMFKYDIHTFMFDMLCLMPFANIYKIAPRTPSIVLILILLGVLWFTVKTISYRKMSLSIVFVTCLYLFIRSGLLFDALFSIVGSLALVYLFARTVNDNDVVKLAYGYIISVSASVIVAYFALNSNLYVDYIAGDIQVGNFTDAIRFKGLFSDPNYLGTYLLSACSILCQLLIVKKITVKWFLLLFLILVFGGLISYSKSFFLTIITIFFLMIFYLWKSGNRMLSFIFFLLFLIVGIYAIEGMFSDVNIILERFSQDSDVEDLTTGRSTLWAKYADNIFSSLYVFLFGNGLDAPLLIQGAHNLYLEIWYYVGSLGLILLTASYISSFKVILKDFNEYVFSYKCIAMLTLVVLLVVYWSLQGFFSFSVYFQFYIAFLMFRLPYIK